MENNVKNDKESIRPLSFESYIGQKPIIDNLKVYIAASKKRNDVLDHVLLYGPPGLGKTTLAQVIANECGGNFKITSAPAIDRPGDLAAILTGLDENDVLFIDEIHRLNKDVQELLYSAIEDFVIDIVIGKGTEAKSIRLDLPRFTLVAATTRAGMLSAPLRDRFGITFRLQFYSEEDLMKISARTSAILGFEDISEDCLRLIAKVSRGTPRITNMISKRIIDFAIVENDGRIDQELVTESLERLGYSSDGFNETDIRIINIIMNKFDGGPVSIRTLSDTLSEDVDTVENVYEPYLIFKNILVRTPRGRVLNTEALISTGKGE